MESEDVFVPPEDVGPVEEPAAAVGEAEAAQAEGLHGACFNKHDGLSDRATDHPPMLFVHCRMVRPQLDSPSCLLKHPPGLP